MENTTLLPAHFSYEAVPDCLRTIYRFNHSEVVNICNDTISIVGYGFWGVK